MIDYMKMLREFHTKFNHYMGDIRELPPNEIVELRYKLINEEAQEFEDPSNDIIFNQIRRDNLPEILDNRVYLADAIADLLYVAFGAALTYDIPIEEVFTEVHRSNMTKSMIKDTKSIKGKTTKGPNFEPPKIKEILFKHMEMRQGLIEPRTAKGNLD